MKSINKTLDILELFINGEIEISLSDLADKSGLNKSTVSRITSTLVQRGYLVQKEKRGKYSLGMKFLDFSGIIKSRIKIRDVAIPHLIKLSQQVNESVLLALWDGEATVLSETIHANYPLRVVPDEGTRVPLHSTGVGKIILANMTEEEFERYFKNRTLERYTPNTITDLNDLKKHIMLVKQEGLSFDDEEYFPGVRNVSAAIKNSDRKAIAAFGVIGPSVRLTRARISEIAPAVKNCALEISRELGYTGE